MDWGFLSFLAEPWFVIPWYGVGVAGAIYVIYDMVALNQPLNRPVKWAWPIIILFFSAIGLTLYWATSRPPHIGHEHGEEKKHHFEEYSHNSFRKTTAAVIHCVGGDGLGIMTAMVIARIVGMEFWMEFWFEYLVGYLFGWFIFQRGSMRMMTDSKPREFAMAFRAEFFSMLTVMAGMGIVMGTITPMVIGEQPKPDTFGFWGFAMLGLLVGMIFTYPMNWLMVKVGWKHGLGHMS